VSGSGDMTGVTVRSGRHGGNKDGPAFGPAVGDATMTSEARPRAVVAYSKSQEPIR